MAFVVTTSFLLLSGEAAAAVQPANAVAIHLSGGKLYRGDELLLDGLSLIQTRLEYLFVYAPGFGLITVSPHPFPDADEAGRFRGERLELTAGGESFTLAADQPILDGTERPAWVRLDRSYSLGVDTPMFGYGDDPAAPERWPRQVGGHD